MATACEEGRRAGGKEAAAAAAGRQGEARKRATGIGPRIWQSYSSKQ